MSNITLTIPNDDHIALRAFGKALIEIASAKEDHPVDVTITPLVISTDVNAVESGINPEITDAYMQGCRDTEERLNAATGELMQAATHPAYVARLDGAAEIHGKRKEPEIDTTAQQVESLATNVVHREVHFNNPASQVRAAATDSTGTPWDERIHSTSKALNADGTWRLRRKPKDVDEEQWVATIQRVQDELRFPQEPVPVTPSGEELCIDEGCDHHGTPHICVTPEPSVTPPADDFHTDAGVVTEQTVAGIPPLPVPPPVVVAPPVPEFDDGVPFPPSDTISPALERMADHTVWDFPRLMTFLTERHGKIDVTTVNMLLAQDGISSVQELNSHPDKIGPFVARVKAHLGE